MNPCSYFVIIVSLTIDYRGLQEIQVMWMVGGVGWCRGRNQYVDGWRSSVNWKFRPLTRPGVKREAACRRPSLSWPVSCFSIQTRNRCFHRAPSDLAFQVKSSRTSQELFLRSPNLQISSKLTRGYESIAKSGTELINSIQNQSVIMVRSQSFQFCCWIRRELCFLMKSSMTFSGYTYPVRSSISFKWKLNAMNLNWPHSSCYNLSVTNTLKPGSQWFGLHGNWTFEIKSSMICWGCSVPIRSCNVLM